MAGADEAGKSGEGGDQRQSSSAAGGNYRIVFAAIWLAIQAILLVTAERRIGGPFDFRSESESTSLKVVLYRELADTDGRPTRTLADDGVWLSRGRDGRNHRQAWSERVPRPEWVFDREAPGRSASTELARLQSALDDVAGHLSTDDDVETRRLILDVTIRRNGHETTHHQLVSRQRQGGG